MFACRRLFSSCPPSQRHDRDAAELCATELTRLAWRVDQLERDVEMLCGLMNQVTLGLAGTTSRASRRPGSGVLPTAPPPDGRRGRWSALLSTVEELTGIFERVVNRVLQLERRCADLPPRAVTPSASPPLPAAANPPGSLGSLAADGAEAARAQARPPSRRRRPSTPMHRPTRTTTPRTTSATPRPPPATADPCDGQWGAGSEPPPPADDRGMFAFATWLPAPAPASAPSGEASPEGLGRGGARGRRAAIDFLPTPPGRGAAEPAEAVVARVDAAEAAPAPLILPTPPGPAPSPPSGHCGARRGTWGGWIAPLRAAAGGWLAGPGHWGPLVTDEAGPPGGRGRPASRPTSRPSSAPHVIDRWREG